MSRRKKIIFGLFGALIGLCVGTLLRNYRTLEILSVCNLRMNGEYQSPLEIIQLHPDETPTNSQRNLVFIGVMTAQNFLMGRASAVYHTWGKTVPGRIAFFSSEGSIAEDLPVIALKGVDDRYPPQKKSFMMLHYMYEHFIDRFEWFMRADDDVFMRTDKLEKFLRSIDSSKPQFIGQAGKGNNEEFGLLSLEFDENFCMGGPGVILSRETLKRVAPHIPTCLKNLYSTHEDVEIGRCVQKFAGIPCTWNYEMQSILHHNSSGSRAFTGNLKSKEVHSSITLHPVKKGPLMFRLHSYMLGLRAQEIRQESLYLHRDIELMKNLLQMPKNKKILAPSVPIFPSNETNCYYLGDPYILGINPDLNRYKPMSTDDIIEWNFIAKSIYSGTHTNPKRKIESALKEGIDDVIREVMENINNFSRQRGRVIEFRELLYGYSRINTLYGQDLILDLLLIYKKYRGKKMTVPVRRHLYIQRSFTEIRIREIYPTNELLDVNQRGKSEYNFNEPGDNTMKQPKNLRIHDKVKQIWDNGIGKITESLKFDPLSRSTNQYKRNSKIYFVLPISGRFETFLRFLNNYEEICIKSSEETFTTGLLIVLFIDDNDNANFIKIINYLRKKYQHHSLNYKQLSGNFSRGIALDEATRSPHVKNNDILFFIDVDMIFNRDTLWRIKLNTIQGQQIYLPIVFSEYDPVRIYGGNLSRPESNTEYGDDNLIKYSKHSSNYQYHANMVITNRNGFFRQFGYGICAIYKSDILNPAINGFNTDVVGWGLEDVKFLEKIISLNSRQNQRILSIADSKDDMLIKYDGNIPTTNNNHQTSQEGENNLRLKIFRAADPSLIHVFHKIHCDKTLDEMQYKMCLGTKANTLGYYRLLESMFLNNEMILKYSRQLFNKDSSNINNNNVVRNS